MDSREKSGIVGKGKPPVQTRFKKGKSGNPKGKPKGTLSAKTIINKWLACHETIKNPVTGKSETVTILDSMSLALIAKARKGDVNAFNALIDRVEGKPKQSLDIEGSMNFEAEVYIGKTKVDRD